MHDNYLFFPSKCMVYPIIQDFDFIIKKTKLGIRKWVCTRDEKLNARKIIFNKTATAFLRVT